MRELRVPEASLRPNAVQARISLAKNRLLTPGDLLDAPGDDTDHLVGLAYRRYDEHLARSRALDFDDLLLKTLELLRDRPAAREAIRARYRYLLVDEYQDTNGPQYEIVRRIADAHRNLCVVGDDDQSIYGWRGADITKILNFERDFPGALVVRLETNYRSTGQILGAANAVIANNPSRHGKTLRAARGDGDPIRYQLLDDEESEAGFVVREILTAIRDTRPAPRRRDFAILVRTANQPRVFEAALRREGIPYTLVGGRSFFDRKEVRDLLAFLKLMANPEDETSLLRIVNVPPRGVGRTTVERVLAFATEHGIPVSAAFDRSDEIEGLPPPAVAAVAGLRAKLAELAGRAAGRRLVPAVRELIDAVDYRAEIDRCYPEPETRLARSAAVEEVVNFAENYVRRGREPTLGGFLEELSLSTEEDLTGRKDDGADAVWLMTLHSAKGLEFPYVFLPGLEEGLLPHARAIEEGGEEEERRLMYVGITRAMRRLTVSFTRSRSKYGRRKETVPSRFLYEMEGRAPPADRGGDEDGKVAPARAGRPRRGGRRGPRRR
jgi:DNA helicase-2/ATP-dependent DNA helicase PcrA